MHSNACAIRGGMGPNGMDPNWELVVTQYAVHLTTLPDYLTTWLPYHLTTLPPFQLTTYSFVSEYLTTLTASLGTTCTIAGSRL